MGLQVIIKPFPGEITHKNLVKDKQDNCCHLCNLCSPNENYRHYRQMFTVVTSCKGVTRFTQFKLQINVGL